MLWYSHRLICCALIVLHFSYYYLHSFLAPPFSFIIIFYLLYVIIISVVHRKGGESLFVHILDRRQRHGNSKTVNHGGEYADGGGAGHAQRTVDARCCTRLAGLPGAKSRGRPESKLPTGVISKERIQLVFAGASIDEHALLSTQNMYRSDKQYYYRNQASQDRCANNGCCCCLTNIRGTMETNSWSMGKENQSQHASQLVRLWYIWAKGTQSYFARQNASNHQWQAITWRGDFVNMVIYVCRCATGEITMMMTWTNDPYKGTVHVLLIRIRDATSYKWLQNAKKSSVQNIKCIYYFIWTFIIVKIV